MASHPFEASGSNPSSRDDGDSLALGSTRSSRRCFPPGSRFDHIAFLGEGGMGRVFRAEDPQLGRVVALKIAHDDSDMALMRFTAEAKAQARIDHPNVVKVFEVGEVQGSPFIVMQYVEGVDLTQVQGVLPLDLLVRIMEQVTRGVEAAHRLGLLHRDLKPQNILIEGAESGSPHPFITDFGLVKELDSKGLTETGAALGTPRYMSPEQALGSGERVDARSDVYALGATMYEVFGGGPVYGDVPNLNLLRHILEADPRPLRQAAPGVPEDLEVIVHTCLAREPERRYPSAQALAEDLDRYLHGQPIWARRPSLGYQLRKGLARHRKLAVLSGMALLALVALGVWSFVSLSRSRRQAQLALKRAELARSQADDLIQYMLGDLYDQLVPIGKVKILQKAGDKTLQYFEGLPKEDLSESALTKKARALEKAVAVQEACGDLEGAMRAMRGSIQSMEDAQKASQAGPEVMLALVNGYSSLSNLLRKSGRSEEALRCLERQQQILDAVLAKHPRDSNQLAAQALAANSASRICQSLEDFEAARRYAEKALAIRMEISRLLPGDEGRAKDLSISHDEVGRILTRLGELDAAKQHLEQAISLAEGLLTKYPGSPIVIRGLGICRVDLGYVLLLQGNLAKAIPLAEANMESFRELHRGDPSNAEWSLILSTAHRALGELKLSAGDLPGAYAAFGASEDILHPLATKSPTNWQVCSRLGMAELLHAEALLGGGKGAFAGERVQAARSLFQNSKTDEQKVVARGLGWASFLDGEIQLKRGSTPKARMAWDRADAELSRADQRDFTVRFLRLRILLHSEDRRKAEPLARTLWNEGIRERRFLRMLSESLPELIEGAQAP